MVETLTNRRWPTDEIREIESIYLYHIPLPAAMPKPELERLKSALGRLIAEISNTFRIAPEYFVQLTSLVGEWATLLPNYGSYWRVQTGLSITPEQLILNQSLSDAGAKRSEESAGNPPTKVELVYRITKDPYFERFYPDLKWPSGLDAYLGCGGSVVVMAPDADRFLKQVEQWLVVDSESSPQAGEFHLPIFEPEIFGHASPEVRQLWFNIFDVYLAEVRSDPGILIASRHDLDRLIEELQPVFQWEDLR
jgi:hypothetical protein